MNSFSGRGVDKRRTAEYFINTAHEIKKIVQEARTTEKDRAALLTVAV